MHHAQQFKSACFFRGPGGVPIVVRLDPCGPLTEAKNIAVSVLHAGSPAQNVVKRKLERAAERVATLAAGDEKQQFNAGGVALRLGTPGTYAESGSWDEEGGPRFDLRGQPWQREDGMVAVHGRPQRQRAPRGRRRHGQGARHQPAVTKRCGEREQGGQQRANACSMMRYDVLLCE